MCPRNSHDRDSRRNDTQCRVEEILLHDSHGHERKTSQDYSELQESPQCQEHRGWKQERQIFCPTLAKLGKAAIHPRAHRVTAVTKKNCAARSLYGARERYVLQQIAGDRSMSANSVVGFTRDENGLSVGRGQCRVW